MARPTAERLRPWLAALAAFALCGGAAACGQSGGDPHTGTWKWISSRILKGAKIPAAPATPAQLPSAATTRHYLRDPPISGEALREDARILTAYYGPAASGAQATAVAATVRRYLATAAAGNGDAACSLLVPGVADSLPREYGTLGAPYLHGARTCQAVLTRMFRHRRRELGAPIDVTGILARGKSAYVLVASAAMPVSTVAARLEHGRWMVAVPMPGPIPLAK